MAVEGADGELPSDFSYDQKTFAREPPPHELPPSFAPLYHSFAFESHKRSNLHYLDEVSAAPPWLLLPLSATSGCLALCSRAEPPHLARRMPPSSTPRAASCTSSTFTP